MFLLAWKVYKPLAIACLIICTTLFVLPGSAFPQGGWMDAVFFDKWVHCGLFFLLVYLWRFFFPVETIFHQLVFLFAFIYGLGIEVMQHYLVLNRSFDLGDLVADLMGAFLGIWLWTKGYKKNRPL